MTIEEVEGRTLNYRGREWVLGAPSVTSDGFVTAWGQTCDEGEPEGHSFFLGAITPNEVPPDDVQARGCPS